LLVPMIDIHTIGAGGGSIAYVDEGGAFRVGPRSAGASPGPAAYGQGGEEATLTDANVVLGRIDPDRFLGGEMKLDGDAAVAAVQRLADLLGLGLLGAAEGIVTIANANMSGAIRSRTVQKGHDPREFALVAFGGAGPMQAAEVAESLGIPEVIVPPYPGITSAMGLLTSDLKYDQMRTVFMTEGAIDAERLDRELTAAAGELRGQLREDGVADGEIEVTTGLDCRYVGQGYELRIPLPEERFTPEALEEFHRLHEQEYGHASRDPIEIVNLRVTAYGKRPRVEQLPASVNGGDPLLGEGESVFGRTSYPTRYFERSRLPVGESFPGPAVIFQRDATTVVAPDWTARAHASGSLILTK
jgi:N-methylhydantoinase A/oxoprolinase/acetone carboxylase beta subunit